MKRLFITLMLMATFGSAALGQLANNPVDENGNLIINWQQMTNHISSGITYSVIPAAPGLSLGSLASPWSNLFVEAETIYLGDNGLSVSNGQIQVQDGTNDPIEYASQDWVTGLGYLTVETDPIWGAVSNSYAKTNWVTGLGYLTTESDPIWGGVSNLYALVTSVPTNNSQLINGAGYLTTETDPIWGGVSNLYALVSSVPTNNSQILNGAGYLTAEADTLQAVADRGNTITESKFGTQNEVKLEGYWGLQFEDYVPGVITNQNAHYRGEEIGYDGEEIITLYANLLNNDRGIWKSEGTATNGTQIVNYQTMTNKVESYGYLTTESDPIWGAVSNSYAKTVEILPIVTNYNEHYVEGWATNGTLTLTDADTYYTWTNWIAGELAGGIGWTNAGVYIADASAVGMYRIDGKLSMSQNSNGEELHVKLYQVTSNGTVTNAVEKCHATGYMATSGRPYPLPLGCFLRFALGDYVEVRFENPDSSGKVVTCDAINFRMQKIGN